MKYILLCLGIWVAPSLYAQKFEIGLNGGISTNNSPNIVSGSSNVYDASVKHPGISPVGSVKAIVSRKKWQYGLSADYRQLAYRSSPYGPLWFPINESRLSYNNVFISKTALPIMAFINRKYTTRHFETYGGISVGYLFAANCEDPDALAPIYYDHVNGNGLVAGIQAGSTYFITKRLGINAEINGDFMWLTTGDATYKLFDFPATVGIRYKF